MKAASLPNLNRETTSFPNFFSLYQDVDHDEDMTLNERPNIDHGDDTEASETSPFNDILSLSLSPLVSSNEIRFLAAPRSVRMFRCESEHSTSSVGSNQFSCDSGGARSEGTNPTQMDYYQQPQMSDGQIQLSLLKLWQELEASSEQLGLLDPSQSFSRSVAPSQTLDMPQAISTSLPQAHLNLIPQQISGTNSQQNLISLSHPSQQPKQSDFPGHVSHTPTSNQLATAGTGTWVPPPSRFQRMRTYTKVYKRGSVGRTIDVTRYSGYEELKQDLARRFGIEGQLENRYRVGWKLVCVDHENDVLVVGDDPWEVCYGKSTHLGPSEGETLRDDLRYIWSHAVGHIIFHKEFVSWVRCIRILSPQEVQAMSLDGDFGNSVLPNQVCDINLQLPAAC